GHGHQDRGVAPSGVSRGGDEGQGAQHDQGVLHGEALRGRYLGLGRPPRGADLRGLRVREGLPGREVLPRREALHDRRGDLRDPEARDREAAPEVSAGALAKRLLSGDTRALARAITLVEDRSSEAPSILREAFPATGGAFALGITGFPG